MFTVLSRTRNAYTYLIPALAILVVVFAALAVAPSISAPRPALIPDTGGQDAHDLFRQEELALYDRPAASSIGSPAFYEYRRGEWTSGILDVTGEFRQEELLLYKRQVTSSIGGPAFYDYRRGEWFGR